MVTKSACGYCPSSSLCKVSMAIAIRAGQRIRCTALQREGKGLHQQLFEILLRRRRVPKRPDRLSTDRGESHHGECGL